MRNSLQDFLEIVGYDWCVTRTYNLLHQFDPAQLTDQHRKDVEERWAIVTPVRLLCGRRAAAVMIPGIFTRMGAMRCKRCCVVAGLPQGKGSPKNDNACREILGMPLMEPAHD